MAMAFSSTMLTYGRINKTFFLRVMTAWNARICIFIFAIMRFYEKKSKKKQIQQNKSKTKGLFTAHQHIQTHLSNQGLASTGGKTVHKVFAIDHCGNVETLVLPGVEARNVSIALQQAAHLFFFLSMCCVSRQQKRKTRKKKQKKN